MKIRIIYNAFTKQLAFRHETFISFLHNLQATGAYQLKFTY